MHVLNVAVGSTPDLDHANTLLMKCNDQIDLVCKMIQVSQDLYAWNILCYDNAIIRKILLCQMVLMLLVYLKVACC